MGLGGACMGMRLGGAWGSGWEEPGDEAGRSLGMRLGGAWG